jgi:hypothetical protein
MISAEQELPASLRVLVTRDTSSLLLELFVLKHQTCRVYPWPYGRPPSRFRVYGVTVAAYRDSQDPMFSHFLGVLIGWPPSGVEEEDTAPYS